MKIRMGFITNSSSTNFLIISKEELTPEYLYKKLGFEIGSPIENQGRKLCIEILEATVSGRLNHYEHDSLNYEIIKDVFGEKSAQIFQKNNNFNVYWGETSSDQSPLTQFFTTDSFEVEEKDFYINGRSCVW